MNKKPTIPSDFSPSELVVAKLFDSILENILVKQMGLSENFAIDGGFVIDDENKEKPKIVMTIELTLK